MSRIRFILIVVVTICILLLGYSLSMKQSYEDMGNNTGIDTSWGTIVSIDNTHGLITLKDVGGLAKMADNICSDGTVTFSFSSEDQRVFVYEHYGVGDFVYVIHGPDYEPGLKSDKGQIVAKRIYH